MKCVAFGFENGKMAVETKTIDDHKAPREVRTSPLGCRNCLWASCECSFGSKYQASEKVSYGRKKVATCKAYTFFD